MSIQTALIVLGETFSPHVPQDVSKVRWAARTFAREQISPRCRDRNGAVTVDRDLLQAGHDAGLLRALVPMAFGGLGLGLGGAAAVLEELAVESTDLAVIIGASMLTQRQLVCWAGRQLQARYLPWFSGDVLELASGPATEPASNAAAGRVFATPIATPLSARRVGDFYVLNGSLGVATNVRIARFATVFAWYGARPPDIGLTSFVVRLDSPGICRNAPVGNESQASTFGAGLRFDDVMVPAENIVGRIGGGSRVVSQHIAAARIVDAAIAAGAARCSAPVSADGPIAGSYCCAPAAEQR